MKECTYCGARYEDTAQECAVDREPLRQAAVNPPPLPKPGLFSGAPLTTTNQLKRGIIIGLIVAGTLALLPVLFGIIRELAGIDQLK